MVILDQEESITGSAERTCLDGDQGVAPGTPVAITAWCQDLLILDRRRKAQRRLSQTDALHVRDQVRFGSRVAETERHIMVSMVDSSTKVPQISLRHVVARGSAATSGGLCTW